jgi:hypothetical protein
MLGQYLQTDQRPSDIFSHPKSSIYLVFRPNSASGIPENPAKLWRNIKEKNI